MTKQSKRHSENALIIAVLLIGGAIFLAGILLIAGVVGGSRPERMGPYGIGLVLVALQIGR